ncbi:MAG: hypothetical protein HKN89_07825 [Eudoraea sp.]|nr:hypothetical protein [Eudoraea sp.]
MRTSKSLSVFLTLMMVVPFLLHAQDDNKYPMYWVHEDKVMPSMQADYEKVAKMLTDKCTEFNVDIPGWITTSSIDARYLYVTPIKSLGDIANANAGFGDLREKMGAEAFDQMFADMNKCYTAHGDYVITMDKELTYMPDGITQTPEGEDYRKFYYLHSTPSKIGKLRKKMMAIKELYQSKGSKSSYRVYRSGFGTMGDFYMVAIASKDAVSFEVNGAANDKLLGEDAKPLFAEVMKYVTKMEEVTGAMRPDLAYTPNISN